MLSPDEEAEFWALYRKTSERLFRKAYRLCCAQKADAEDVHQRAYLKALEHWMTVSHLSEGQQSAWLATTLTREFLQLWRAAYRHRETHSSSDLAVAEPFVSVADAADAFAKSDEYRMTCRAIALLHGRQREVIALHCLAGYEIAEVAEMLGITEETVRVHLSGGRRRLRVIVAKGRWHDDQG